MRTTVTILEACTVGPKAGGRKASEIWVECPGAWAGGGEVSELEV